MPLHQRLQPGGGRGIRQFLHQGGATCRTCMPRRRRRWLCLLAVHGCTLFRIVLKMLIKSLRKGNHWGKLYPVLSPIGQYRFLFFFNIRFVLVNSQLQHQLINVSMTTFKFHHLFLKIVAIIYHFISAIYKKLMDLFFNVPSLVKAPIKCRSA